VSGLIDPELMEQFQMLAEMIQSNTSSLRNEFREELQQSEARIKAELFHDLREELKEVSLKKEVRDELRAELKAEFKEELAAALKESETRTKLYFEHTVANRLATLFDGHYDHRQKFESVEDWQKKIELDIDSVKTRIGALEIKTA
jgi:thioesterase domain-containing protein